MLENGNRPRQRPHRISVNGGVGINGALTGLSSIPTYPIYSPSAGRWRIPTYPQAHFPVVTVVTVDNGRNGR